MYRHFFKRGIDLLVSVFLLIVLSPLLLCMIVLLPLTTGQSPFFCQTRPGKNGKLFRLVKFKTMHDGRNGAGELLPDAERFTGMGKLLRKTSLDELPQLFNVLKGEMSLVGPRPLLVEYLPLYSTFQARRHEVLPGITGWAQVNGRNAISWEQKFIYDVWYVDHVNWSTDIRILYLTVWKVIRREGVNARHTIPMEKFTGNTE